MRRMVLQISTKNYSFLSENAAVLKISFASISSPLINNKRLSKMDGLFRISSAVEQWTVNPLVAGSNPASGEQGPSFRGAFFFYWQGVCKGSVRGIIVKKSTLCVSGIETAFLMRSTAIEAYFS